MKISFSATFLTSLALGFLFVTGRSIIDGAVLNSGFNYQLLGFEFSDYAFYGFMYCYHYLLIINLLISLTYLLYQCFLHRLELKIRISYLYHKLKIWQKDEDKLIDKESFYNKKRIEYNSSEKFNLLDELLKQASFSYFFFIVTSLLIYWALLIWVSKSNDGQKDALSDVLGGVTYIENSGQKYFLILCGKERCLYATKDFEHYYNSKKDEMNTNVLEKVNIVSANYKNVNFKAYILNKIQAVDGNIVTLQINLDPKTNIDRKNFDCNLNLISTPPKIMNNIKEETHHALSLQETRSINNLIDENDSKTYFISYFLPQGQEIKNLYYDNLPSNSLKIECLNNQMISLNNRFNSALKTL
ncbi:hypothetical protein [Acinetobacter wuhouensis]|uniref:Uncharacterized protein n=1 Tax=Acinetobacter wuhouensis TaxID=1879050 RepID=A0A4Q7AMX8_9GAMM|nr:hypothetical protein [Acinetobacter wuhouensis]RZG48086.1 hypothetical protein EXU28_04790 [Acinetobacter wuhouensis]